MSYSRCNGLLLLVSLWVSQYLLDPFVYTCVNDVGRICIALHHLINVLLLFGSLLFGWHSIHLLMCILSLIVHVYFGICPITTFTNNMCKTNHRLYTCVNHVGDYLQITDINTMYHIILTAVIVYDLCNIDISCMKA